MMPRDLKAEFERLLAREGGLYTFDEVMERVQSGKMQAFCEGDTLVITEIQTYPRKKVLNVNYVVGRMEDLGAVIPKLVEFQEAVGAEFIGATGRIGWVKKLKEFDNWKIRSINFMRV